MKNVLVILAFIFAATMAAQDVKPTFEKVGNLVKATYFHNNGKVQQLGFYKDKKLHGEWISYNSEGKKISTGNYNNGKKTGKWFFWEGEGDKLSEVNYNNNQISSTKTWAHDSNVAINFNKN